MSVTSPDMAMCFCRSLRRASTRIVKLYATALAAANLRPMEFALLAEIDRRRDPGVSELAESFQLDRSTLRYKLAPLERARWVEIKADSRDARSRRAFLTDGGRAKLAEAMPLWTEAQDSFARVIGGPEAEALRTVANLMASAGFAEAFAGGFGPPA